MRRDAGFSLIEMMVALTIMALAAGAVIMSVGSPGGTLAAQTDRLIASLAAARDQALIANRTVSVEISEAGYRTIIHSQVAPPTISEVETWAEDVSVTMPESAMPAMVTFDPVGLAVGAQIDLKRGAASDGVIVLASGQIRRPGDAP